MRAYFDISTRIVFDHSKPACQSFPMKLTFAFCTYNRAPRLERLVAEMRSQESPIPFEILAVNNNSTDKTLSVLETLAKLPGVPLRVVTEESQGIVPARNRALEESLTSDIIGRRAKHRVRLAGRESPLINKPVKRKALLQLPEIGLHPWAR